MHSLRKREAFEKNCTFGRAPFRVGNVEETYSWLLETIPTNFLRVTTDISLVTTSPWQARARGWARMCQEAPFVFVLYPESLEVHIEVGKQLSGG